MVLARKSDVKDLIQICKKKDENNISKRDKVYTIVYIDV